jgi:hypothetical protein
VHYGLRYCLLLLVLSQLLSSLTNLNAKPSGKISNTIQQRKNMIVIATALWVAAKRKKNAAVCTDVMSTQKRKILLENFSISYHEPTVEKGL